MKEQRIPLIIFLCILCLPGFASIQVHADSPSSEGGLYTVDEDPRTTTYKASGLGQQCYRKDTIVYYQPRENELFPLFIFLEGSHQEASDAASLKIIREMASAGYVAAIVNYKNGTIIGCNTLKKKARCIFSDSSEEPNSAVQVLCNDENIKADCSLGVVASGVSQGAILSILSENYTDHIRAVYAMSVSNKISTGGFENCMNVFGDSGSDRALPSDKLRIITGESDQFFSNVMSVCGERPACEESREELWNRIGRIFYSEDDLDIHCPYIPDARSCIYESPNIPEDLPVKPGWVLVDDEEITGDNIADHVYQLMGSAYDTIDPAWYDEAFPLDWTQQPKNEWSLIPRNIWVHSQMTLTLTRGPALTTTATATVLLQVFTARFRKKIVMTMKKRSIPVPKRSPAIV